MKNKNKRYCKKISKRTKKIIAISLFSLLCLCFVVVSLCRSLDQNNQDNYDKQEFITSIKPTSIQLNKKYHVPASIIMGQAILESDYGTSDLATKYHNLFGVKAGVFERKVKLPTKEYRNGQWETVEENFKVYSSWQKSLEEHTKLLVDGTSWNHTQYQQVRQATNYRDAAVALENAGYATDPHYAEKLIKVIEENDLAKYDIY